jgi:hypothetical protein
MYSTGTSRFLLCPPGVYNLENTPPPPPGGREYQPMSSGGKNMKRGRKKKKNVKEKAKNRKEKEKLGSKRVK